MEPSTTRRWFLGAGGAVALALMTSCSGGGGGATGGDVRWLRTASSLDAALAGAYQSMLDRGLFSDQGVAATAALFRAHHTEHGAALQRATRDGGADPYTEANPFLQEAVVLPSLELLSDQASALALASSLETLAAQTYAYLGRVLASPAFRQTAGSIAGAEARHGAVLARALGLDPAPVAILSTLDRLSDDARV